MLPIFIIFWDDSGGTFIFYEGTLRNCHRKFDKFHPLNMELLIDDQVLQFILWTSFFPSLNLPITEIVLNALSLPVIFSHCIESQFMLFIFSFLRIDSLSILVFILWFSVLHFKLTLILVLFHGIQFLIVDVLISDNYFSICLCSHKSGDSIILWLLY